jgi:hypothetical protein
LERLTPNPKLKFMDQCREAMRFHRLALRTEEAYLQWIKRFLVFHRGKAEMLKAERGNEAATQQHRTSNEGGGSGAHGVTRPTTGDPCSFVVLKFPSIHN